MPTSLSVASVVEKNKLGSNTPFLIALDITVIDPNTLQPVEVIHLVRNNEDLILNGVEYIATPFTIELKQDSGAIPDIKLSITDYTRAIQARLQAYGGGVRSQVKVMVINADALDQPPEVAEYFEVTGTTASQYVVNWTLGAESPLARIFPAKRQHRDMCRWRYRGVECAYAGDRATCDLTLKGPNGCEAHQNQARFGGFPGINATQVRYA